MKTHKLFSLFFCMILCVSTAESIAYSANGLRTHWLSDLVAQNKKKLAAVSGFAAIAGFVYAYRDRLYKFYNDFRFSQLLLDEWKIISVKAKRAEALENPPARVRGWRSQEEEGLFGKKVKVLKYDDKKPVTKTGKTQDSFADIKSDYAAAETVLCEKFKKDFFPELYKKIKALPDPKEFLGDESDRLSKYSNSLPNGLNITSDQARAAMEVFFMSVTAADLGPEINENMKDFFGIKNSELASVDIKTPSRVVHNFYREIFGQDVVFVTQLLRALNDDVEAVTSQKKAVEKQVDEEQCDYDSASRFVKFNQIFLPKISQYLHNEYAKKDTTAIDPVAYLDTEIDKLQSNVLCGGDAGYKLLQDKKVIVATMQRLVSSDYFDNAVACSEMLRRNVLAEKSLDNKQNMIYKFFNPDPVVVRPMKMQSEKKLPVLSRENLFILLQKIPLPLIEG